MFSRFVAAACVFTLAAVGVSASAHADDETIVASVSDTSGEETTPPPDTIPQIPCTWRPASSSQLEADKYNTTYEHVFATVGMTVFGTAVTVPVRFYYEENTLRQYDLESGNFVVKYVANCSNANAPAGVSTGDIDWRTVPPPDPLIALDTASDEATKTIKLPQPDINPATRSAINLGLWLAVTEAGPYIARAELSPTVWAEVTATLASTTFDMGNGDVVTCDGFGTPITDAAKEAIEQGPCGYTYEDVDDIGDTTITVASTWTITWALSDGRTGTQPDITVTDTIPYEVYEIQTVGTGG